MSDLILLDESGVHIKNKEEVKTYLKDIISSAYGMDINFNPTYPDGILVEGLATMYHDMLQTVQGLYNAFNIRNASGVMLDILSNLINVHRKSRTQALITVPVILEPGIIYNISGITLKDQNNILWKSGKSIDKNLTGETEYISSNVDFTCSDYGEVAEPTSFSILAPVDTYGLHIGEIVNGEDRFKKIKFVQGTFDEDDISLRTRVISTPTYNSISVKENLIKKLLDNEFVKSVKIYNNDTDDNIYLKKRGKDSSGESNFLILPPTQVAIVIQYNEQLNPSDQDKEIISKIISDYKGLCTITFNPNKYLESISPSQLIYFKDDENGCTVYYMEALQKKGVIINIDIFRGTNYNSETIKENISSIVIGYLSTLEVGEDLTIGGLISHLYNQADNRYGVNRVTLGDSITGETNLSQIISEDEYFPILEKEGVLEINTTVNGEEIS